MFITFYDAPFVSIILFILTIIYISYRNVSSIILTRIGAFVIASLSTKTMKPFLCRTHKHVKLTMALFSLTKSCHPVLLFLSKMIFYNFFDTNVEYITQTEYTLKQTEDTDK